METSSSCSAVVLFVYYTHTAPSTSSSLSPWGLLLHLSHSPHIPRVAIVIVYVTPRCHVVECCHGFLAWLGLALPYSWWCRMPPHVWSEPESCWTNLASECVMLCSRQTQQHRQPSSLQRVLSGSRRNTAGVKTVVVFFLSVRKHMAHKQKWQEKILLIFKSSQHD